MVTACITEVIGLSTNVFMLMPLLVDIFGAKVEHDFVDNLYNRLSDFTSPYILSKRGPAA